MTEQIWKGNPKLEPFLVSVKDLRPNPENARKHTKRDIDATAASFNQHGQQEPIVVTPDKVLMAGEGRWLAVLQLGWTHIAALASDIKGDGERYLYMIRDNRTAELSYWDLENLSKQLQALNEEFNLKDTGLWEPYELDPLLNASWEPPTSSEDPSKASAGEAPGMADSIRVTVEQRQVFERAMKTLLDKIAEEEGGEPDVSEGRALELICADWLSGN